MNRVCLTKDGKLIEMQGGGKVDRLPRENEQFKTDEDYTAYLVACDDLESMRLNTLKQNALSAGYTEADIEVKWVTDEEWAGIQEANKPIVSIDEQKRRTYQNETDPLYAEWQALLAVGHPDAETRRLEWVAKREEISVRTF